MGFEDVSVDDVRAYWNAHPCNLRHSDATIGSKEYFEEVRQRKYFVEDHIPAFADFHAWKGKRVLDIGCGLGSMTQSFAEAGASVTAVDISLESLSLARRRMEVMGLTDRVEFFEANAEQLSDYIPTEAYDLIFSFGVLHHTPHPQHAFDQFRLFSKPGTRAKVMVYHRRSTKTAALVARHGLPRVWEVDKAVAKQSEAQFGCPITYTYTKTSGAQLLQRAGFVVDDARAEHIFPYAMGPYKEYRYVKRAWWRLPSERMFHRIEQAAGWHLLIDAHMP